MSRSERERRRGAGTALLAGLVLLVALTAACAKVEEAEPRPSGDPKATYIAARLIPPGKTVRSAVADGSITATEVPGDRISEEGLEDTVTVECLVAGVAIPSGTLLRRSMFVDPESIGIDRGYTDGTTLDPEC